MLIFAAQHYTKWPNRGTAGKTCDIVPAALVGAAIIVHDGLAEVIAIGQRPANDGSAAEINGIEAEISRLRPRHLDGEFMSQQAIKALRFRACAFHFCRCFFQQASAFAARPRLHPLNAARRKAQRLQTIKGCIDPAL